MAVAAAPDLVLDALLMFGAIGYTWEHDTHLYWRRATSLAASLGPMTHWTREVGELARTCKRSTTIDLGDVESEFRAQVATTLDKAMRLSNDHYSGDIRTPGLATGPQRDLLAQEGLVAPNLPAPWGIGASAVQQVIIADEFGKRPEIDQALARHRGMDSADDPQQRIGSATRALRPADPAWRTAMVPIVQRTRCRLGSGVAIHPGHQGRRGMAGQRAQDLDIAGATRLSSERCWRAPIPTRRSTAASATSSST